MRRSNLSFGPMAATAEELAEPLMAANASKLPDWARN
jgi:hypothetical protein